MPSVPELDKTYFAQHVGIAEEQLAAYIDAAGALEHRVGLARLGPSELTEEQIREDSGTPNDVAVVQNQVQTAWLELWTQLDAARTIVERAGRATAVYDAIRDAAREHAAGAHVDFGQWRAGRQLKSQDNVPFVRTIKCVIAPPSIGRDAISALTTAMPEVPIRLSSPYEPVADLRKPRTVLWLLSGLGLAAAVTLVVFVLARS